MAKTKEQLIAARDKAAQKKHSAEQEEKRYAQERRFRQRHQEG